jgi:hypothetical protein
MNRHRRRFLGAATVTIAAAQLGIIGSAAAQTFKGGQRMAAIEAGTNTSFGPLKQIDAGVLNIRYGQKFSGPYEHRTITGGIGHNLPQEALHAFAQAVVDVPRIDRRKRQVRPSASVRTCRNQRRNGGKEFWNAP